MIDITADVVEAINDDAELALILDGRVYGYSIPAGAGAEPPLVVVIPNQSTRGTFPQTQWWKSLVSIDFHATDPETALALATRMQAVAPTIVGVRDTCVISDCQVDSVQPVADDGWTPTRFRQIVSVVVTAREP